MTQKLPIRTALLRNFSKNDGDETFRFHITARDADFEAALLLLKRRVPSALRTFDEETKFWTVRRTPETERALKEIFHNGVGVITLADAQLRLPL
jgi:hypothetical protein